MSRQLKDLMTESLRERYAQVDEACVVNITGLNVAETIRFRRSLISKNMRVSVVKNSLARRAFAGGALEPLGRSLVGPCALVTGGSAISVAREIIDLAKALPKVELKSALLAGESEVLPLEEVAQLKSQPELIGDVAMLIASPGRALAACLKSAQSKIAGCLKALAEAEAEAEHGEVAEA